MTSEETRMFREAAQVLLMLLRCISMKRALGVSSDDHLNFFRLYDSCLTDGAVLAWCKIFGSKNNEKLHWQKLFPSSCTAFLNLTGELEKAAGCNLEDLSKSIRNYRNTFVAHHDLDEAKRAKVHPHLDPLRCTGQLMYAAVFTALYQSGSSYALPKPDAIMGHNLLTIEKNWESIIAAARSATADFKD